MIDKELLELAAKAAGIEYPQKHSAHALMVGDAKLWNSLTDDGDALRLAVKLDFCIKNWKGNSWVSPSNYPNEPICFVAHDGDKLKSTRLAIVRAAAEIGKTK